LLFSLKSRIQKSFLQNFWVDLSSVTRLRIWVEVLESLMGCDLGNICAQTREKSVMKTENVDYFTVERERDETNVTNDLMSNDDLFRSVCSAYLRTRFVVCADMNHSPRENPTPRPQQFHFR
jgi:hypothetical protein